MADALSVLDELGLSRVVVFGHSFGGAIAVHLARAAPERVERLVLLDPAIGLDPQDMLDTAEETRDDESYPDGKRPGPPVRSGLALGAEELVEDELGREPWSRTATAGATATDGPRWWRRGVMAQARPPAPSRELRPAMPAAQGELRGPGLAPWHPARTSCVNAHRLRDRRRAHPVPRTHRTGREADPGVPGEEVVGWRRAVERGAPRSCRHPLPARTRLRRGGRPRRPALGPAGRAHPGRRRARPAVAPGCCAPTAPGATHIDTRSSAGNGANRGGCSEGRHRLQQRRRLARRAVSRPGGSRPGSARLSKAGTSSPGGARDGRPARPISPPPGRWPSSRCAISAAPRRDRPAGRRPRRSRSPPSGGWNRPGASSRS